MSMSFSLRNLSQGRAANIPPSRSFARAVSSTCFMQPSLRPFDLMSVAFSALWDCFGPSTLPCILGNDQTNRSGCNWIVTCWNVTQESSWTTRTVTTTCKHTHLHVQLFKLGKRNYWKINVSIVARLPLYGMCSRALSRSVRLMLHSKAVFLVSKDLQYLFFSLVRLQKLEV